MENNDNKYWDQEDADSVDDTELSAFPEPEETAVDNNAEAGDSDKSDAEITKLKSELEEQKEKYVRLFAEFDNFKRRTARERNELAQTAGKEVISSLLEVLDDVDRAEKQINETDDAEQIKQGINLVFNKFRKSLKAKGLEEMESIGTDFDVEKHEAITEIPVQNDKQKGKVVDEIQKGYYLNDKLIRFAKVVVGK